MLFDGHIVQSVWTISQIAKRMISSLSRYHIFGKHSHVNEVKILTRDDLESFADAITENKNVEVSLEDGTEALKVALEIVKMIS